MRKDDEAHLHALCDKHLAKLRIAGVETIETDDVRAGVDALIERTKPEVVCMATRGRSGIPHLLLGSVAEHTLRTAGVPVIVTKGAPLPADDERLRVLLGLDFIDDPGVLARRTARYLGPDDELMLGHVVESMYFSPAAYGTEFSLPQPDVPALIDAATRTLQEIDLGENGPKTSVHVVAGRPRSALLDMERDLGPHLLVARTHGRRGFDRLMLGSVSEFLARKCRSALLVYPKMG